MGSTVIGQSCSKLYATIASIQYCNHEGLRQLQICSLYMTKTSVVEMSVVAYNLVCKRSIYPFSTLVDLSCVIYDLCCVQAVLVHTASFCRDRL